VLTRFRLFAVAVVAAAGALWMSAPAQAVQTTTWGIIAAPSGNGYRSTLSHAADGSTVHDAVIVFNRTGQPITVHLSVLGATFINGAYQYTNTGGGLATRTALAAGTVTIGAHQQARVPVTIRMPRGTKVTTLAAIAAEAAPIQAGALVVQQRLVVLIKATPSNYVLPVVGRHLGLWVTSAVVALALAALLIERERRRVRGCPARPSARVLATASAGG
jgi:hypothetical protein